MQYRELVLLACFTCGALSCDANQTAGDLELASSASAVEVSRLSSAVEARNEAVPIAVAPRPRPEAIRCSGLCPSGHWGSIWEFRVEGNATDWLDNQEKPIYPEAWPYCPEDLDTIDGDSVSSCISRLLCGTRTTEVTWRIYGDDKWQDLGELSQEQWDEAVRYFDGLGCGTLNPDRDDQPVLWN